MVCAIGVGGSLLAIVGIVATAATNTERFQAHAREVLAERADTAERRKIRSVVAVAMCKHVEMVIVTNGNGDQKVLLDPSNEVLSLLNGLIKDDQKKLVVTMKCGAVV